MAKVSEVNINIEGEEYKPTSFMFDDSIRLDNMVEFTLEGTNKLMQDFNDGKFTSGKTLIFSFGFANDVISSNRVALLTDTEIQYQNSGVIRLKIRGLDKGTILKKAETIKDWSGKLASEIAKDVAEKYGLGYEVEDTEVLYENLHQCSKNDFEFLSYLALLEGGYIFYIQDEILYFVQRGLDKDSYLTYTYGSDDSIISFNTSKRDSTTQASMENTSTNSVNDDKTVTTDNIKREDLTAADMNLGVYELDYLGSSYKDSLNKQLVLPNFDTVETVNITESLVKETKLQELTGTLKLRLNPLLRPDSVITLEGNLVGRDIGNWYVERVTHTVNATGTPITSLSIAKNGVNVITDKVKSANINESKGEANQVNTSADTITSKDTEYITIKVYEPNGKLKGYKTNKGTFIPKSDKKKVSQYSKKPITAKNASTKTVEPESNFSILDSLGKLL